MTRPQLCCSLLLNLFVVLSVFGSCAAFFLVGGKGNMKKRGKKALVYFTVDSNLLCAAACLAVCVRDGLALAGGCDPSIPRWLDLFKFAGTAAAGVTFFTVLFYLLPVTHFDFKLLYAGRNLFLHALSPLAAMASWTLTEQSLPIAFGWVLLGLIPTVLYGALYLNKVLLRKEWEDFYRFNAGGKWPISIALMLLLTFLISVVLWALR